MTSMSITNYYTAGVCLKIHFLFQGKYYEQVHGIAMDSPISPLVANLFMEEFESKTIRTVTNTHRIRLR